MACPSGTRPLLCGVVATDGDFCFFIIDFRYMFFCYIDFFFALSAFPFVISSGMTCTSGMFPGDIRDYFVVVR